MKPLLKRQFWLLSLLFALQYTSVCEIPNRKGNDNADIYHYNANYRVDYDGINDFLYGKGIIVGSSGTRIIAGRNRKYIKGGKI